MVLDTPHGKLLVWDLCKLHIAGDLKEFIKVQGIKSAIIPGGLMTYVQHSNIGIYKLFKDKMLPLINKWKSSSNVELTRGGNPKPPKDEIVCNWVKTEYHNVNINLIKKSIAHAGFDQNYKEWHIFFAMICMEPGSKTFGFPIQKRTM